MGQYEASIKKGVTLLRITDDEKLMAGMCPFVLCMACSLKILQQRWCYCAAFYLEHRVRSLTCFSKGKLSEQKTTAVITANTTGQRRVGL